MKAVPGRAPKSFVILVGEGPYSHQAGDSALQFARAVLESGHILRQVFFYHDGVYLANRLAQPEQAERKITQNWAEFAREYRVRLVVCSNTAAKRGVVDTTMATLASRNDSILDPAFTMAGLGQFAEAVSECDRLVRFK